MDAPELIARLRVRYAQPRWAFLEQVPNGMGPHRYRTADGIAVATQEALGYQILGFEVKVSRQDWISERDNPYKSIWHREYCDGYYLVVGDPGIVKDGELPEGWGLLVPYGKALREAVGAVRAPAKREVDREFLAALVRRAAVEMEAAEGSAKAIQQAWERGRRSILSLQFRQDHRERALLRALEDLEKTVQSQLGAGEAKELGPLIRSVRRGLCRFPEKESEEVEGVEPERETGSI